MSSLGSIVAKAVHGTGETMKVPDDLLELSAKVAKQGVDPSDRQAIKEGAEFFSTKALINRDGTLRSGTEKSPPGITYLRQLKSQGDERALADAVRNVRGHQFTKDGSGVGGTPLMVEALTKPGWQHSGRQVKIVHMSPIEYLQRSAKGHGLTQEELMAQIAQGDRTDQILQGMAEGKRFDLPYLDYRNGGFGQEGQHRAMAAAMTGQEKIPVAVLWNDVKTPVAAKADHQRKMDEAGFDTDKTFIHGTEVYRPGDEKGRRGLTEKQLEQITEMRGVLGVAAHVTLDPKFANLFSNATMLDETTAFPFAPGYKGPGGVHIPFHLKKDLDKEAFDMNKKSHVRKLERALDDYVGDADYPELESMTDAEYEEMLFDLVDTIKEGEADFSTLEALLPVMKKGGYRAFVDYENVGGPPTGIAVFDGEDMKSVFAKAEKFGKESTFLGGTGAAVGLSQPDSAQAGTNPKGKLDLPHTAIQAQSLLSKIGQLEAGGSYDIGFGGTDYKLRGMTIERVLDLQEQLKKAGASSTAMGKYQFINKTLAELVKKNPKDFPKDRLFDEQTQDQLAAILLKRRGFDKWKEGKISDDEFLKNLSKEWASLPNPDTGRSYYAGDGLNKSLTGVKDLRKILNDLNKNMGP